VNATVSAQVGSSATVASRRSHLRHGCFGEQRDHDYERRRLRACRRIRHPAARQGARRHERKLRRQRDERERLDGHVDEPEPRDEHAVRHQALACSPARSARPLRRSRTKADTDASVTGPATLTGALTIHGDIGRRRVATIQRRHWRRDRARRHAADRGSLRRDARLRGRGRERHRNWRDDHRKRHDERERDRARHVHRRDLLAARSRRLRTPAASSTRSSAVRAPHTGGAGGGSAATTLVHVGSGAIVVKADAALHAIAAAHGATGGLLAITDSVRTRR